MIPPSASRLAVASTPTFLGVLVDQVRVPFPCARGSGHRFRTVRLRRARSKGGPAPRSVPFLPAVPCMTPSRSERPEDGHSSALTTTFHPDRLAWTGIDGTCRPLCRARVRPVVRSHVHGPASSPNHSQAATPAFSRKGSPRRLGTTTYFWHRSSANPIGGGFRCT